MWLEHEYWYDVAAKMTKEEEEEYLRSLRRWCLGTLCFLAPLWFGVFALTGLF